MRLGEMINAIYLVRGDVLEHRVRLMEGSWIDARDKVGHRRHFGRTRDMSFVGREDG
jgi:hypothetical protein